MSENIETFITRKGSEGYDVDVRYCKSGGAYTVSTSKEFVQRTAEGKTLSEALSSYLEQEALSDREVLTHKLAMIDLRLNPLVSERQEIQKRLNSIGAK